MEFDSLGRLVLVEQKDPIGVLLSSKKITYDAVGNKTLEKHGQFIEGKSIGSKILHYRYGMMGRLEEEKEDNQKSIHYSYNSLGQLLTKTSSLESSSQYTYDLLGRLEGIECSHSQGKKAISNHYTYDQRGNVILARALNGTSIERKYNVFNQIVREIVSDEFGKYETSYTYDRKGRLTSFTLPDQSKVMYAYDALYGKEVKRLSSQGEVLYSHQYTDYDQRGSLLTENVIHQGGKKEFLYNLNGQRRGSKSEFLIEEIKRDWQGRIIAVNKKANFKITNASFEYNSRSQLISEKSLETKTYGCDSLDNRHKENEEALIYNASQQLVKSSKESFFYDPQGNLSRKILDGEETTFESDCLSQLITIRKSDQIHHDFTYDALGRLIHHQEKRNANQNDDTHVISRFLYIGYQEIGSLNEKGEIETLRIPGLHGDQLSMHSIAIEKNEECFIPVHDFAGNVTALIHPATKQVIESYLYSAFGKETIYNGLGERVQKAINPWRFAEKRKIDQFVSFGFRFYDPAIGRWITPDPAGFSDGPNRYAYLHHHPFNYLDQFGLSTEDADIINLEEWFYGEEEANCPCGTSRVDKSKRGGAIRRISHLPKVKYCESFEESPIFLGYREDFWASDGFRPYFETSHIYDLGLSELGTWKLDLLME